MGTNDWIHTRRGATLVEGTLPRLARGLQSLTAELARFNDREEAGFKQEILAAREESLAELEELRAEIKAVTTAGENYRQIAEAVGTNGQQHTLRKLQEERDSARAIAVRLGKQLDEAKAGLSEIQVLLREALAARGMADPWTDEAKTGLTFEQGCDCLTCRMRREAEAIADEPDKSWQSEDPRR